MSNEKHTEDSLIERLREFHEKPQEGAWTNLFALARNRAKADGLDIIEAVEAELKLRV